MKTVRLRTNVIHGTSAGIAVDEGIWLSLQRARSVTYPCLRSVHEGKWLAVQDSNLWSSEIWQSIVAATFIGIAIAASLPIPIAAITAAAMGGWRFWISFSWTGPWLRCGNFGGSPGHVLLANRGNSAETISAAHAKPGRKPIGIGEIGK